MGNSVTQRIGSSCLCVTLLHNVLAVAVYVLQCKKKVSAVAIYVYQCNTTYRH